MEMLDKLDWGERLFFGIANGGATIVHFGYCVTNGTKECIE